MTTKIRIKLGIVEIDYEGEEKFFKEELPQILKEISRLIKDTGVVITPETPPLGENQPTPASGSRNFGTLNSIAAKLNVNSGSELIIAAAASLTFNKRMETFSRDQLLTEMKTATSYFKTTYVSNYSAYLSRLVGSGKLFETATNTYALSATQKTELESRLAA